MSAARTEEQLRADLWDLVKLRDDFNEDDSDRPSGLALGNAIEVIRWAMDNGLPIEDVGPDAMGGAAVYLGVDDVRFWVACMNQGGTVSVIACQPRSGPYWHSGWTDEARAHICAALDEEAQS